MQPLHLRGTRTADEGVLNHPQFLPDVVSYNSIRCTIGLSAEGFASVMALEAQRIIGLLIAALGGLAVGMERQRSGHASGARAHFAGLRTFTLLGGLAGLAGWLWADGQQLLATLLIAGAVGLVVTGYVAASRHGTDGTTEVAALVVLAAGLVAAAGDWELAAGVIAITTLLLAEKTRLHDFVRRVDDASLRAGIRFAVMAVVILPLLPEGPYGPWGGIRPRNLWLFVLLFSGLSFIGSIARRAVGAGSGYSVTGMLGGLISSTNVTLLFSRLSQTEKNLGSALAVGVVAASTVLLVRVTVALALINPALARMTAPYFAIPFLLGGITTLLGYRRLNRKNSEELLASRNPLEFKASIAMAVMFQAVFYLMHWLRTMWGEPGVLASGAVLGFADMDALTISLGRTASGISPQIAVQALVIGMLSNTVLKTAVSLFMGKGRFRWLAAGGLVLIGVALAVSLALLG